MTIRNRRTHRHAMLTRDCPTCGRKAGQPCVGTLGARGGNGYVHVTRRAAVARERAS